MIKNEWWEISGELFEAVTLIILGKLSKKKQIFKMIRHENLLKIMLNHVKNSMTANMKCQKQQE